MKGKRERLDSVDRATGFAIILVVVGHLVARQPPAGHEWWLVVKGLIYSFHMPFFMFLSGMVFRYTFPEGADVPGYVNWLGMKAKRLVPGFLLVGSLILLGKGLAANAVAIDNPPGGNLLGEVAAILLTPARSVAGSLWYIYVLLELYALSGLMLVLGAGNVILLALGVVGQLLPVVVNIPDLLMLDRVCEYLFFFALGGLVVCELGAFTRMLEAHYVLFYILFLCGLVAVPWLEGAWVKPVMGLSAIASLYHAVGLRHQSWSVFLTWIGSYTFTIYLLNTIMIGAMKGVGTHFVPWGGAFFFFYIPVLALAGLFGPILLYRVLTAAVPGIAKIMR